MGEVEVSQRGGYGGEATDGEGAQVVARQVQRIDRAAFEKVSGQSPQSIGR